MTTNTPPPPFKNPLNVTKVFVWGIAIFAGIGVAKTSGDPRLEFLAYCSIGFVIVISRSHRLWPRWWFWSTMGSFIIFHAVLAQIIDWTWLARARGITVATLIGIDILAMSAVLVRIYGWLYGKPAQVEESCIDDEPSYSQRDLGF